MNYAQAAIATGLIVVAPGPALAISLSSAVDGGRRAGLLAITGLAAGITLHAAIAATGLAVLFAADPRSRSLLQVAGALFLVAVGARMIVRSLRGPSPAYPGHRRTWPSSSTAYVARGLLTNVLNPWILGFYVATLPLFTRSSESPFLAAALVAAIHVSQLAVWHGLWVLAVSSVTKLYERRARALRLTAGAALVATGAWFMVR